jgi:hypothetical protein
MKWESLVLTSNPHILFLLPTDGSSTVTVTNIGRRGRAKWKAGNNKKKVRNTSHCHDRTK